MGIALDFVRIGERTFVKLKSSSGLFGNSTRGWADGTAGWIHFDDRGATPDDAPVWSIAADVSSGGSVGQALATLHRLARVLWRHAQPVSADRGTAANRAAGPRELAVPATALPAIVTDFLAPAGWRRVDVDRLLRLFRGETDGRHAPAIGPRPGLLAAGTLDSSTGGRAQRLDLRVTDRGALGSAHTFDLQLKAARESTRAAITAPADAIDARVAATLLLLELVAPRRSR